MAKRSEMTKRKNKTKQKKQTKTKENKRAKEEKKHIYKLLFMIRGMLSAYVKIIPL